MVRHEQQQDLTIAGKEYRIRKFTPETACYWATRLLGDVVGKVSGGESGKSFLERVPEFIQDFTRMDRKAFGLFQKDCLDAVQMRYESGFHPLVGLDGNLPAEAKAPVVMQLTIRAFMFSIADFFDPALLAEMLGAATEALQVVSTEIPTSLENSSTSL